MDILWIRVSVEFRSVPSGWLSELSRVAEGLWRRKEESRTWVVERNRIWDSAIYRVDGAQVPNPPICML